MNLEKFKDAKILIVDDEPANLRVIYNLLKEYPFRLFTLQDSTLAMETIEKEMPDLILLDIMMPGINGYELCKLIKSKEHLKKITIIFVSALNETTNIVTGFELGAVDYISKPFQNEEVVARLNNHLTIVFQEKELIRLVSELEQNNQKLKDLNQMKNKFFSIIAHDVKNPFAGILGIADMLYEDFDSQSLESIKTMVGHIHTASKKCYRLLDNLLQWANSQLEGIKMNPAQNDFGVLVQSILDVFALQIESKKIILNSTIPSPAKYYGDKNMVDFVVRNLLNNAIKFTPTGGTIQILCEENNNFLKVSIKDSGIGIPEDILKQLFVVGGKVTRKGTNKEDGTGLGLLVCSEFVEKLGGEIQVRSIVNEGSTFTFTLPVNQRE